MEWFRLRTYAQRRQRPKNVYCSSPVPGVVASVPRESSKTWTRQTRQRLFSPPIWESQAQSSVKGNPNVKALPKITENFAVTQMNNSSSDHSDQLNDKKATAMEANEDIYEKSTTLLKESLPVLSQSKESLRNSETTSGMTLPTGVSTFLLDCLDMDSSTESMDNRNSCSSPEIFRDEDSLDRNYSSEECLIYKNSTLLDTSKAVTIDKMPQLSNLSEILEPVSEDHQDQHIKRVRLSKCNKDSSELTGSTVVSGKQVFKMTSTQEKTPNIRIDTVSSLSARPKRQHDDQTAYHKNTECRKRVKFRSLLKSETSSCHQLVSPAACISAKSDEPMAELLPSEQPVTEIDLLPKVLLTEKHKMLLTSTAYFQPEELEFNLSPVRKSSLGEDLFLNSTGPYVNSEEIAPASLSSEEKTIYQSLHNKETQNKKLNAKPKEICCIIKTSPGVRLSVVQQIPVNGETLHPHEGIPEDVITSTKNWVYSDHG